MITAQKEHFEIWVAVKCPSLHLRDVVVVKEELTEVWGSGEIVCIDDGEKVELGVQGVKSGIAVKGKPTDISH